MEHPQSVLAIGPIPGAYLRERGVPASGAVCRHDAAPAQVPVGAYDLIVAGGQLDFTRYLDLALFLRRLRDGVRDGGTLVFIKRPRELHDAFFRYRDEGFFERELPDVGRADFASVTAARWQGWQIVEMRGKLNQAESRRRLRDLGPGALAHLPLLAERTPLPGWIWTAATTRCNLRCRTCSLRDGLPGRDMSPAVIDRIFDALGPHVHTVNVTGIGEPLCSRAWEHLHARIRQRPLRRLELVTNAMLLREEHVRSMMCPENPTTLILSIDGNTKETYEFVRDGANWERLMAAMETIQRLRRELRPGPHFQLGVDFVALKDNVAELPGLIGRLGEWQVDLVFVIEMGDWETNREFFSAQALRFYPALANRHYALARAEAAQHPFALVSIPPDFGGAVLKREGVQPARRGVRAWRMLCSGYDRIRANPGARRVARVLLRLAEAYCRHPRGLPERLAGWVRQQYAMARYPTLGEFRRVGGFCPVVVERAYFHVNGDVSACCGLPQPVFGNLSTAEFASIWDSAEYREFRIMNVLGYPHAGCYYCTLPYGLPRKNPENFIAAHRLPPHANWLARVLRKMRADLPGSADVALDGSRVARHSRGAG